MTDTMQRLTALVSDEAEGRYALTIIEDLEFPKNLGHLQEFSLSIVANPPDGMGLSCSTLRRALDAVWPLVVRLGERGIEDMTYQDYQSHVEESLQEFEDSTRRNYRLWINRFVAYCRGEEDAHKIAPLSIKHQNDKGIVVEFLPEWDDILALLVHCEDRLEKTALVAAASALGIRPFEIPLLEDPMFTWHPVTGITLVKMPPSAGYPEGRTVCAAWGDEIFAAIVARRRREQQPKLFPPSPQSGNEYREGRSINDSLVNLVVAAGVRVNPEDLEVRPVNLNSFRFALAAHLLTQRKGEQPVRQMLGLVSTTEFGRIKRAADAYMARSKVHWGTRADLHQTPFRRDCPVCHRPNAVTATSCQNPGCRRIFTVQRTEPQLLKERIHFELEQFLESIGMTHSELANDAIELARRKANAEVTPHAP